MADKKISALTASSTPLAGTEVLPIVQSGATVKVAVSDLTAGRAVLAASLTLTTPLAVANGGTGVTTSTGTGNTVLSATPTLSGDVTLSTGNLVIGTAGKGIDFSITSEGSGTMTSELLADYEEGTWTPSVGGTATYHPANKGEYVKVGNVVTCQFRLHLTAIGTGSTSVISGLPFTSSASFNEQAGCVGLFEALITNMTFLTFFNSASTTTLTLNGLAVAAASTTSPVAVIGSSTVMFGSISYRV